MQNPLVSVAVLAYNLEKYVDECIKNLVNQNFDYPYEIVIGEDCSTDNTRKICLAWQDKYPQIIRVLPRNVNLGMAKNFADIVQNCKGEFITFCEADDYWNNPIKLKLQYEYLKNHPQIGLVHTNFEIIDETGNRILKSNKKPPEGKVLKHLLRYSFVATVTVMIRKQVLVRAISERRELILENGKAVDYPLWLTCATFTQFGYLDVVTATYRYMNESASHSQDINKKIAYQNVNRDIALKFQREYFPNDLKLQKSIFSDYYYSIFKESVQIGDRKSSLKYFSLLIKNDVRKIFSPKVVYFFIKSFFSFLK